MSRSLLPQNYTISDGDLLFNISDSSTWTASNAVVADDTTNVRTGVKSVKITSSNTLGYIQKSITPQKIPQGVIDIWVYAHDDANLYMDPSQICLYFSSDSFSAPKCVRYQINVYQRIVPGWNLLSCGIGLFDGEHSYLYNGESVENEMNAIRIKLGCSQEASLTIDSIYVRPDRYPRILINFDDVHETVYTNAYPIMDSLGLKGTAYACKDKIGTEGYLTLTQLHTLYDAGWTIGNHTVSHSALSQISHSQVAAEIEGCRDWLISEGLIGGENYLAYPGGAYNDYVLDYCSDNGILTGRCTERGNECHELVNRYRMRSGTIEYPYTLDFVESRLKLDMNVYKNLHTYLFHDIVSSGASQINEWDLVNFEAAMKSIVAKKIKCQTIDEWYKGLTNPRYRAIPLNV